MSHLGWGGRCVALCPTQDRRGGGVEGYVAARLTILARLSSSLIRACPGRFDVDAPRTGAAGRDSYDRPRMAPSSPRKRVRGFCPPVQIPPRPQTTSREPGRSVQECRRSGLVSARMINAVTVPDLDTDVLIELGRVAWAAIVLEDYVEGLCSFIDPSNPREDRRSVGQKISASQSHELLVGVLDARRGPGMA